MLLLLHHKGSILLLLRFHLGLLHCLLVGRAGGLSLLTLGALWVLLLLSRLLSRLLGRRQLLGLGVWCSLGLRWSALRLWGLGRWRLRRLFGLRCATLWRAMLGLGGSCLRFVHTRGLRRSALRGVLPRLTVICLDLRGLRLLRLLEREELLLRHVLRLTMRHALLKVHLHSHRSHVRVSLHGRHMRCAHTLSTIGHCYGKTTSMLLLLLVMLLLHQHPLSKELLLLMLY